MAGPSTYCMVSYQTFIDLAFAVAKAKGADYDGINDGAQSMRVFADLWNQNKTTLKSYTEQQARSWLQDQISVQ